MKSKESFQKAKSRDYTLFSIFALQAKRLENHTMQRITLVLIFIATLLSLNAQTPLPSVNPTMTYINEDGQETTETQYDGSAPLTASFRACPENTGDYTPLYEWRFTKNGGQAPFLVRYDEDTNFTFSESGTFAVELRVSFVQGTDTISYSMDTPFTLTFSESKLEVPNAFSPNDDGVNDIFKVKEDYKSIISFKAMVFDRWGKKLYEWTDLAGGWDGTSGGSKMPDGAYYLNIQAKGADGKKYNIKKVITLLRGYTEKGTN